MKSDSQFVSEESPAKLLKIQIKPKKFGNQVEVLSDEKCGETMRVKWEISGRRSQGLQPLVVIK